MDESLIRDLVAMLRDYEETIQEEWGPYSEGEIAGPPPPRAQYGGSPHNIEHIQNIRAMIARLEAANG